MSPVDLAQQITAHRHSPDFRNWLEQMRPHLTLEVIRAIINQATQQYLNSAYQALELARLAQQVAAVMDSPEAEALAAWSAGGALHFLCHYQEALDCFRLAVAFYHQQGRTDRIVPLQVNQVAVLQNLGRNQEAIELAEATRPLCEALGEKGQRILANLETNIGPAYQQVGNLSGALQAYQRAYQIFQALEDSIQVARTEINQALVLEQQAEFAAAIRLILRAKEVLTQAGQAQEVARADLNLGVMTYRMGHYQAALNHLENSQQAFTAQQNLTEVAVVKLYRSFVYRDLGLIHETITMAQEAEAVLRRSRHAWSRTWCLINQAAGYRQLERFAAASHLLTKARRILKQLKAQTALFSLDLERAELALQADQSSTAQRIAYRLLKQADIETYPFLHAKTHLIIAQALLKQTTLKEAVIQQHIQQAQAIAERHTLTNISLYTYYVSGLLADHQGNIQGSRLYLQKAITEVERLKSNVWLDELRVGFMDDKLPIYQALVALEHHQARNDQLDSLLNALSLAHTAPWPHFTTAATSALPDETYDQIQALRQRWHWLQSQLDVPGALTEGTVMAWSASQQTSYRDESQQIETQLAELSRRRRIQQLEIGTEMIDKVPFAAAPLPRTIQANLQPGQLFLFYYLLDDTCHVVAMTAEACYHFPSIIGVAHIQRLLQVWQFHITTPAKLESANSLRLAQSYLQHLYNALIQPLAAVMVGCHHLYVVLPAAWQNLPLTASYDGQQYLIEKFAVTYLTSPTAWTQMKQPAQPQKRRALVMGHSQGGQLPFSVQEAQQVANTLAEQWAVHCFTEAEAATTAWRELGQKSHLIHLAAHATFRPDNPFFSWINLADERLTVADLYEMAFPLRPLIVLSACETGRGVPKGGGLLGLARALFAAGASGLVLSHWPLEDSSTTDLMTNFYQQMLEQPAADVSHLLRMAQLTCMHRYPHPFFWAGPIFLQG